MGRRCAICRMETTEQLVRVPLCGIRKNRLVDFAYVSVIHTGVFIALDGPPLAWLVDEIGNLVALSWCKHKVQRYVRRLAEPREAA